MIFQWTKNLRTLNQKCRKITKKKCFFKVKIDGFLRSSFIYNHIEKLTTESCPLHVMFMQRHTHSELFQAIIVVDDCTQTGELYSEDRE